MLALSLCGAEAGLPELAAVTCIALVFAGFWWLLNVREFMRCLPSRSLAKVVAISHCLGGVVMLLYFVVWILLCGFGQMFAVLHVATPMYWTGVMSGFVLISAFIGTWLISRLRGKDEGVFRAK